MKIFIIVSKISGNSFTGYYNTREDAESALTAMNLSDPLDWEVKEI